MPDHRLKPATALGAAQPQTDQIGTLQIVERPDVALASVAARSGQMQVLAARAAAVLGCALPAVGQSAGTGAVQALWIGPEQWMFCAPHHSHETLADDMAQALCGIASVTEQSDAWVCFEISGPAVAVLLERLCNADFRRMERGEVQRTMIEHTGCLLVVLDPMIAVRLFGPRSAAKYLHHAVSTAAVSVS
ncbi:MAG: sarcosine oxidase subunit gamma [Notoacmeibacter sp.]|nr:sarcosine oxidase subunit gamma [Notoacmeibacter sp.]